MLQPQKDKYLVKIGDFGLARHFEIEPYKITPDTVLSVKWLERKKKCVDLVTNFGEFNFLIGVQLNVLKVVKSVENRMFGLTELCCMN